MCDDTCISDCAMLSEVTPSGGGGGTTGVIPLSVEMLSDSDDEVDRKPQLSTSSLSATVKPSGAVTGPAAGGGDGKSKLLLLKMATEFVEAAAAAANSTSVVSLLLLLLLFF